MHNQSRAQLHQKCCNLLRTQCLLVDVSLWHHQLIMASSQSNAIASSSSTNTRSKPQRTLVSHLLCYVSHPLTCPTLPASKQLDENLSQDEYSSDESDETEDEDGAELTPAMDAAILRTLAMIRKREGVYGSENILQSAFGIGIFALGSTPPIYLLTGIDIGDWFQMNSKRQLFKRNVFV